MKPLRRAGLLLVPFSVAFLISVADSRQPSPVSGDPPSELALPALRPSAGSTATPGGADMIPSEVIHTLPWPWPGIRALPELYSPRPEDLKHDILALARYEDPMVLDPGIAPRRLEEAEEPLSGPALAIGGLNAVKTLNLGSHSVADQPQGELDLRNLGDAPLRISRIFAGCSCLRPSPAGAVIDPAGWLEPMLVLEPGESTRLTLQLTLDGGEFRAGEARALYLQIFSDDPSARAFESEGPFNDSSLRVFDPVDPIDHEMRLRIVVGLRAPLAAMLRSSPVLEACTANRQSALWRPVKRALAAAEARSSEG